MSEQELKLVVTADTGKAMAALNDLARTLERIKRAVQNGMDLNRTSTQITRFSKAIDAGISNSSIKKLNDLTDSIKKISAVSFTNGLLSGAAEALGGPAQQVLSAIKEIAKLNGTQKVLGLPAGMEETGAALSQLAPEAEQAAEGMRQAGQGIEEAARAVQNSNGVFANLSTVLSQMDKLTALAVSGVTIAVTVAMTATFDDKYLQSGDWNNILADSLTTLLGSAITGPVTASALGGASGFYGAGLTVALSGLVNLRMAFGEIVEEGLNYESIVLDALGIIKGGIAGALVAAGIGASVATGAAVGIGLTAVASLILGAVALDEYSKRSKAAWGDVVLAADEVKSYAEELFTQNVGATIHLSNITVTNLDEAKQNLQAAANTFNVDATAIRLGIDTQGSLTGMLKSLTGGSTDGTFTEESLLGTLKSRLGSMTDVIQLGVSIMPAVDSEGLPMDGKAILEHAGISESSITEAANDLGGQLAAILADGLESGLDAEQAAMVSKLSYWLEGISQAVLTGQVSGRFLGNLRLRLGSLDRLSFENVLEEYNEQIETVKSEYESLAVQQESALQGLAAGMEATYRAYLDLYGVDDNRTKQALADWENALKDALSYDPMETVNAWLENAKMEARETVSDVLQKVFSEHVQASGVVQEIEKWKSAWESGWDTWAKYGGDLFAPANVANQFNAVIEEALQSTMTKKDWAAFLQAQEILGLTGWDLLEDDIREQLVSALRQAVGDEHAESVLKELGISDTLPAMDEVQEVLDKTAITLPAPDNTELTSVLNNTLGSVTSTVDSIIAQFSRLKGLSFGFSGGMFGGRLNVAVPAAAEGGMFTTGQMFIAREAGPELVGRMGNKSAVVNNDQIVQGIAGGVAAANANQERTLSEIASALKRIERKEFSATVVPSSSLGKVVKRSEEMYARCTGTL